MSWVISRSQVPLLAGRPRLDAGRLGAGDQLLAVGLADLFGLSRTSTLQPLRRAPVDLVHLEGDVRVLGRPQDGAAAVRMTTVVPSSA